MCLIIVSSSYVLTARKARQVVGQRGVHGLQKFEKLLEVKDILWVKGSNKCDRSEKTSNLEQNLVFQYKRLNKCWSEIYYFFFCVFLFQLQFHQILESEYL